MSNDFALAADKLDEIATRYETACLIAMTEIVKREHDDNVGAARFMDMRRGIWIGVADELRELGCPETNVGDELARVIAYATRRRALESLPTRGSA